MYFQEFGKSVYYHLVLEDVSLTKGCKPPPKHILEVRKQIFEVRNRF